MGSEALAIQVKSRAVIGHDRMNQEFPYVIAAIMVPSNWCQRASPTTQPAILSPMRRERMLFFLDTLREDSRTSSKGVSSV